MISIVRFGGSSRVAALRSSIVGPVPGLPKILVTGTMSRRDLVAMFDGLAHEVELVFVEYAAEWGEGVLPELYAEYGALRTWEDSVSANRVLAEVRPDLVAFVSCSSYNQVALRSAARARGVRCVHVEHGLRRPPFSSFVVGAPPPQATGPRLSSWRTHAFFVRSFVRDRDRARLVRYVADIRVRGPSDTALRRHADVRRLDHYISFSPECFDYHRQVDRLEGEAVVTYVGVPQFDAFATGVRQEVEESTAILVDHQFVNGGLLGWDLAFRDRWAAGLASTLGDAGITLHVKEHPGDRTRSWQRLGAHNVRVLEGTDLPDLAQRARTVLGVASTLQMPLAALPHVAHIALEMHPLPGARAAQAFVTAGVAEPVYDFSELAVALNRRREIAASQQRSKAAFERQFLFRLDGRSADRFRSALLAECAT